MYLLLLANHAPRYGDLQDALVWCTLLSITVFSYNPSPVSAMTPAVTTLSSSLITQQLPCSCPVCDLACYRELECAGVHMQNTSTCGLLMGTLVTHQSLTTSYGITRSNGTTLVPGKLIFKCYLKKFTWAPGHPIEWASWGLMER